MTKRVLCVLMALLGAIAFAGCGGSDDAVVLVDVRTPEEFTEAHLAGAINVNWQDVEGFARWAAAQNPADEFVLYCRTGNRAEEALTFLASLGFEHVTNVGSLESAALYTGHNIVP
ncbi:MAG: rhodanese-like domain-containing protein [Promicromonosporaceae bacterium]|nr:rhodanese-like domain-containing protein [Promicromonosporaceae bacterium]